MLKRPHMESAAPQGPGPTCVSEQSPRLTSRRSSDEIKPPFHDSLHPVSSACCSPVAGERDRRGKGKGLTPCASSVSQADLQLTSTPTGDAVSRHVSARQLTHDHRKQAALFLAHHVSRSSYPARTHSRLLVASIREKVRLTEPDSPKHPSQTARTTLPLLYRQHQQQ